MLLTFPAATARRRSVRVIYLWKILFRLSVNSPPKSVIVSSTTAVTFIFIPRNRDRILKNGEEQDAKDIGDDDTSGAGSGSGDRPDRQPLCKPIIRQARALAAAGRPPPTARGSGANGEKPERPEQPDEQGRRRTRPQDQEHLPRLLGLRRRPWDQVLRAARAIPIREAPPNTRLMPTKRPMTQSADPGNPVMMMAAIKRSMSPATTNQDHRSDSSRRCSSAYMMLATPSARK